MIAVENNVLNIKQIYDITDYFIVNVNATLHNNTLVIEPTAQPLFNLYPNLLPKISQAIADNKLYVASPLGHKCYHPFGLHFSKSKLILLQIRDWYYNDLDTPLLAWSTNWLKKFANENIDKRFDLFATPAMVNYFKLLPQNCYVNLIKE